MSDNEGNEIPLEHHQRWDAQVRELAQGLTIMRPARGASGPRLTAASSVSR